MKSALLLPGADSDESRDVPPVAASGVPIANCAGCRSHFRQQAAEQILCSQCRYWQVVYRAVFPKGNP